MDRKKRRHSSAAAYRRRTGKHEKKAGGKLLALLLLAGLCVAIKSADSGLLHNLRESAKEVFADHLDVSDAIETLGQSFSKGNAAQDNVWMVFGRMILGLDESVHEADGERDAEMPDTDNAETENLSVKDAQSLGPAESAVPLLDPAALANALSAAEIDDSTVDMAFRIPSPDIVDDSVYTPAVSLSMPLKGYRVTSGFGYRIHPISGNTTFHYGADLAASAGTDVLSVANGKVSETGYGSINGNYVKITHADGYASHYTHLQTIDVRKGESVTHGERVGTVGSTGYSTGPHLHFELRRNGKILDPFKYFAF